MASNFDQCSTFQPIDVGNLGLMDTYYHLKYAEKLHVVRWCMSMGLIATGYTCPTCGQPMTLSPRREVSDGFAWSCRVQRKEGGHLIKRSIRIGTWFEKSKMSLPAILMLTYMWCSDLPTRYIIHNLGISKTTAADWGSFCREVLQVVLKSDDKIGGPDAVVEIDESKFGKRKYNRGKLVEGSWVFGGVERGTKRCFFSVVENRSKEVLLSVIKKNIKPGTTIVSDCWKAYDCLADEGFIHLTVNHSLTFKDPDTGAHTNSIEGTWSAIKRALNTHQAKDQLESHLAEYLWRRKHNHDPEALVKAFFECVKLVYPPRTKDQQV